MQPPRFETLPNGLRLVLAPQPHLHTACIAVFVKVGSRYESAADNGLSHFLEHMLFRGTERLPSAFALNDAIESLGGTLYAATHADFTVYQVVLPPECVDEGLRILGELFRTPVFSEIETEKGIVREEILEAVDEDGRNVDADDLSRELVFGAHPLGFKITGDAENVTRFTHEDLRRHLDAHYGASNAVLVLSGAIDEARHAAAARDAFGPLRTGTRTLAEPPDRSDHAPRFKAVDSQGSQTDVRVCFLGFGERDPRRHALQLLVRVLDDGMSTRLHRRICDDQGLAYDVFAGLDLYEDCGIFDIGSSVDHKKTPELVREVLELARGLRDTRIEPRELDKAKRRYRWEIRAMPDDVVGVASFHGTSSLFELGESLERLEAAIEAVTAEDLQEAARAFFRPERLSVLAVGSLTDRDEALTRAVVQAFA